MRRYLIALILIAGGSAYGAGELKHADVGANMTRAEFVAATTHVIDGATTGDVLYSPVGTTINRLAIGTAGQLLRVESGLPAWSSNATVTTATYATTSTHALTAALATLATNATTATYAVTAGSASTATTSTFALTCTTATVALTAETTHALTADNATTAVFASTCTTATVALTASTTHSATSDNATTAVFASTCTTASAISPMVTAVQIIAGGGDSSFANPWAWATNAVSAASAAWATDSDKLDGQHGAYYSTITGLAAHAADATAIHGITDTSKLVVGPTSAVNLRIAVFDGVTGKLIKDGGSTIADVTGAGATALTAAAVIADNRIPVGAGGARATEDSGVSIDPATQNVTGITTNTLANIAVSGKIYDPTLYSYIDLGNGTLDLTLGAVSRIAMNANTTNFNNAGADIDFIFHTPAGQALEIDSGATEIILCENLSTTTLHNDVAMPDVYGETVSAGRDLVIASDGRLGYTPSTRRAKKNIRDTPTSRTAPLLSLSVVDFEYLGTSKAVTGLIAEDALPIYPEAVSLSRTTGEPETVVKSRLIIPMLHLIQQQQAQIDALTKRVEALEGR